MMTARESEQNPDEIAAVELLRSPYQFKILAGNKAYVITQQPVLPRLLGLIPLALIALGCIGMATTNPAAGTAPHLIYELGAVLVVLSLLLAIAGGEARRRHQGNEAGGKQFRKWTRIGLGVMGVAIVIIAFQVSQGQLADFMVTFGVAMSAAVALDALIVEPGEKLYAFSLAGTKVISVTSTGDVEVTEKDPLRKKSLLEKILRISIESQEVAASEPRPPAQAVSDHGAGSAPRPSDLPDPVRLTRDPTDDQS
jgi:hypothetical protein